MSDVREEFEAWADSKYSWLAQEPEHNTLSTWSGSSYENRVVQSMWEAWQASRAALKVELPDVPDFGISAEESLDMEPEVYESLEAIHCAEVAMLNRCKRALQQAGIEVK